MKIEPNLRIFVTGKTQSGKTKFTRWLIKKFSNMFIYDVKRQYSDLGAVVHDLNGAKSVFSSGCYKVVYQPNDLSVEHFDDVCAFIRYNLKNILFVVEEAHTFATKHKIPKNYSFLLTVCQGDPFYIGILSIAQRPASLHNNVISQSSIVVAFKQFLQEDADAVKVIPAQDILNLKPYHYIVYWDDGATGETHVDLCAPVPL